LGLVVAIDDEGYRVVERLHPSGAHRREGLAEEGELHDLDGLRWPARRFAGQRGNACDARVGEYRRIEQRGLLGFLRVPEEQGDLLHGFLLSNGKQMLRRFGYWRRDPHEWSIGRAPDRHPALLRCARNRPLK